MRENRSTEELIKKTLRQLLEEYSADEITVKMLCMEAGISKQTLYNHYYCIMDALEDSYVTSFLKAVDSNDTYGDWVKGFQGILEMFFANRKAMKHIFDSTHREEFMDMIYRHGEILVRRGIDECSRDIGITVDDRDRNFMVRFYMFIFMGIIEDYFDDKMQEDPSYITSRCDAMLRHHIRRSLYNISAQDAGQPFFKEGDR